jgi:ribose 5-phosphate isomerase B
MMPKIAIGCDHAGFEYKEGLKSFLERNGYEVKDFGTYSKESTDYPDFAHPVAEAIENNHFQMGVLICGSANGVAMAANKHKGVRAALCWLEEVASLARQHNNANVVCLPARFISYELAEKITDRFLHESFEGGRHERRVNKIATLSC